MPSLSITVPISKSMIWKIDMKFYDWNEKMFKKYNNVRLYNHPNPVIRYTENKRISIIVKSVKDYERIADIGCGEGYLLSRIDAVGVDISETALKRCPKGKFLVRANAEHLPFSEGYFDAAVCTEVIEHTEHPDKVVSELSRIVRPNGRIVITAPNESLINTIKDIVWKLGLFDLVFPNVPKRQNDEWHLHSFDLKMLKDVCRPLEIEKIRTVPFFFLPIRYIAICKNKKPGKQSKNMFSRKPRKKQYLDAL